MHSRSKTQCSECEGCSAAKTTSSRPKTTRNPNSRKQGPRQLSLFFIVFFLLIGVLVLIYVAKTVNHDTNNLVIPECASAPWKQDEDLVGTCPGNLKRKDNIDNAVDCASSCCDDPSCITWQFRRDKGCLQGGDVRTGMEKDGPSAYCSDHPPYKWMGQYVKEKPKDCATSTWNPHQQLGQCFGLGDVRKGIDSSQACMEACCRDESCGAWQYQEHLGCFYNKNMHSCQKSDDPVAFEPFVGRRKFQESRGYTGPDGKKAQIRVKKMK